MNPSVHRVGLAVAALAMTLTLGGFFAIQAYLTAHAAASTSTAPIAVAPSPTTPAATLPPDVVYVRPAPPPQVIHVVQKAPPTKPPRIVHVTVPSPTGGDDGGGDDGGGD